MIFPGLSVAYLSQDLSSTDHAVHMSHKEILSCHDLAPDNRSFGLDQVEGVV